MKKTTIFLLFYFMAIFVVFAQTETAYSKIEIYPVRITLTDTKLKPIPNASVLILTAKETIGKGKTDKNGKILGAINGNA